MIATIYSPDGIVISTSNVDVFYHTSKKGDLDYIERLEIKGHPHIINFWNKYILVFHQTDEFNYQHEIINILENAMKKWESDIPPIHEFMPYVKKQIIDYGIQIIGIMAGYCSSKDDNQELYVYQILGESIRRINIDENGYLNYNCVLLEKETNFSRLFREIQIKNGDEWETLPPTLFRCDLFSIEKSKEITKFILESSMFLSNINSSVNSSFLIETVIITPTKIIIL